MKNRKKWSNIGFLGATVGSSAALLALSGAVLPAVLAHYGASLPMSSFIALNVAAATLPSAAFGAFSSYEHKNHYFSFGSRGLLFAATTALAGYFDATPAANITCSLAAQSLYMLFDHTRDCIANPPTKSEVGAKALQCALFAGTAAVFSYMFDCYLFDSAWLSVASTSMLAASLPIFANRVKLPTEVSCGAGATVGGLSSLPAILATTIFLTPVPSGTDMSHYNFAIMIGKVALVGGLAALSMFSLAINDKPNAHGRSSNSSWGFNFNFERDVCGIGGGYRQQQSFSSYIGLHSFFR